MLLFKMLFIFCQYHVKVGVFNNGNSFKKSVYNYFFNKLPFFGEYSLSLLSFCVVLGVTDYAIINHYYANGCKNGQNFFFSFVLNNYYSKRNYMVANVLIILMLRCWSKPWIKKYIYIYIYIYIYQENFSICHWNLNTFLVHNYAKLWLFKGYVNCHNFDIVYLSESYLDSLESVSATLNCLVTN